MSWLRAKPQTGAGVGFRFHRSFRLFPGVRLNLSKSGVSATLGVPGANVNIRGRRLRRTMGIPGSGLSHVEEYTLGKGEPDAELEPAKTAGVGWLRRLFGR